MEILFSLSSDVIKRAPGKTKFHLVVRAFVFHICLPYFNRSFTCGLSLLDILE